MTTPVGTPDPEQTVEILAQAAGLALDPAHRPGVAMNFQLISGLAALVTEFPLDDTVDLAPVFTP